MDDDELMVLGRQLGEVLIRILRQIVPKPAGPQPPPPLLTPAETAEILRISTHDLARRVRAGEIQVVRTGRRSRRFRADEVARYIEVHDGDHS